MTETLSDCKQFLSNAWDNRLWLDPLYATKCGDRRFNDHLPGSRPVRLSLLEGRVVEWISPQKGTPS